MRRAAPAFALSSVLALGLALGAPGARAGDGLLKVIPPGNEKLVADMLGSGATLPEQCALTGASIEPTRVVAAYACGGRPATIELRYKGDPEAATAAARTAEFAVLARAGAPAALVDDVTARIRAREKAWRWVTSEVQGHDAAKEARPAAAGTPAPHRFFVSPTSFGGAALLTSALSSLIWLLAWRRRPAPTERPRR
jgi:hypothetical protein